MISSNLFINSSARKISDQKGIFSVIEFEKDLSISPDRAQEAYFASSMNVRKKQLAANINSKKGVFVQASAMQMMLGDVDAVTNVKSAGDLFKKVLGGIVSGETAIKPYFTGDGTVLLEPTFKFILLENLDDWAGGIMLEDGMFLAAEDTVEMAIAARSNASSLIFGGEGIFNLTISGSGYVALESPVPADELVVIDLVDDVVKIDGSMAIAWSPTLDFTVEKATPTLIGSLASGEGLVNVYRGTGRVLVAPVRRNRRISHPES